MQSKLIGHIIEVHNSSEDAQFMLIGGVKMLKKNYPIWLVHRLGGI